MSTGEDQSRSRPLTMKFEFFVAARYLRAKRRQAVMSIITVISIVGVAAGVFALVVALAITNGFRQDLQNSLLRSSAQVQLQRVSGDGVRNWRELLERLRKEPHVLADSPALYEQVMISRGARSSYALLKGIVPQYERNVSALLNFLVEGSAEPLDPASQSPPEAQPTVRGAYTTNYPPIILGKDMADDLGATVGALVVVTSPQGELTPMGPVPKFTRFRVAGIMKSGFYDYDRSWALIRLADSQRLFGEPDIITVVEFKIDDIYRAREIAHQLEQAAGPGFQTTNWIEQNAPLFRALTLERIMTFIVIALIVLVGALNILIALTMLVMEKTRDIAVLMSLGARRRQIRRIFIDQGLLIGVAGTLIGLIAGYSLAIAGGHYRWIPLNAQVYSIDYLPFAPRAIDGVLVGLVSLALSLIATIYPSYSASRILPAEALRYE
jgi:lipoprotein-releasing system permease protein